MKLMDLSSVKEGMKLAKPVTDSSGNILLKEGTELTARWIEILRSRKVYEVYIEEEGNAPQGHSEEEKEDLRNKITQEIDRMFRDFEGNALMKHIAEAAKRYLISKVR